MLKLNNVEVVYDRTILVLRGVSCDVPKGQIVALLGSNGAGKSTTLKTISGILRPERGEVDLGGGDSVLPRSALDVDAAEEFQYHGHFAFGRPPASAGDRGRFRGIVGRPTASLRRTLSYLSLSPQTLSWSTVVAFCAQSR